MRMENRRDSVPNIKPSGNKRILLKKEYKIKSTKRMSQNISLK